MRNNNCTEKEIKIILSYLKGSRKISNDSIKEVTGLVNNSEVSGEIVYQYFYDNYPKIINKQELHSFDSLLDRASEYCNKHYIRY